MNRIPQVIIVVMLFALPVLGDTDFKAVVYKNQVLKAEMVEAEFYYGDSNYNAIIQASDGNVYYVINSHNLDSCVHMFRYNPRSNKVTDLGAFNDILNEDGLKVYPQGKVHVDFYEYKKKLYFTTHTGSYERGGSEEFDRGPYPGGHIMSYDLKTGKFKDYGISLAEEGLITMAFDKGYKRIYAITWPSYGFVYYDIETGKTKAWAKGVKTLGIQDRASMPVPRSLGVDPRTGNAYWYNGDSTIACYDYSQDAIVSLKEPDFDAAILKAENVKTNKPFWRSIRWSDSLKKFCGVMWYSDYAFTYDPEAKELEIMDRICAGPVRKNGKVLYSSLAFELSEDGNTAYYIAMDEFTVDSGDNDSEPTKKQELHVVTYNFVTRQYIDHGVIELSDGRRPRYCQGLEIGKDGNLYLPCWIDYTDFETTKGKKILEARYSARADEDKDKPIHEVNLIVIKDPLLVSK